MSEEPTEVVIKITQEELADLLLTLGYATAATFKLKQPWTREVTLRAINAIGRNLPGFIPYEVGS